MTCLPNNNALNPNTANFIKPYQGEFVAIEGVNMMERINLSDIRIPYHQLIKGVVRLQAGQSNYFFNHLGLGDNATFLLMRATYDTKSKMEADNFIQYSYSTDKSRIYTFADILLLTGNSENRVPQLILSNPNQKAQVRIDVMVATIDGNYSYFDTEDVNQKSITFTGLKASDITCWQENVIIAVLNSIGNPQAYIGIADINSHEVQGKIVIVDDASYGSIYLDFISVFEAKQAASILSYIIENGVNPSEVFTYDTTEPIMLFSDAVTIYGSTISATTSIPNTIFQIPDQTLSSYSIGGGLFRITKFDLANLIIDKVECGELIPSYYSVGYSTCSACNLNSATPSYSNSGCYLVYDNRDGLIPLDDTSLIITKSSIEYANISATGSYDVTFNISDIASNTINTNMKVKLNVI